MPMLVATGVTVRFGERVVLDDVGFEARQGELVALCGPNGAGKTTLLRVLAGELRPDRGDVSLGGRHIRDWTLLELARARAVLPQQTVVQFDYTAEEIVRLGLVPRDLDALAGDRAVDEAMARTETTHLAARIFTRLSGGEASRVNLARVLAQGTATILLDEPTAALDVRHQALTLATARALARQGASVIAVLHDLNLAAQYADRIVLLGDGAIRAEGHPHDVLSSDLLSAIYGHPITVIPHPIETGVLVLPSAVWSNSPANSAAAAPSRSPTHVPEGTSHVRR